MVASCNLVALLVVAVLFLIQNLCASGRIPGADKLGRTWAIPADAIKPPDGRETSGKYKNWRK